MPRCRDAACRRNSRLSCDLFLAIGSSLVVWPAAGFPLMAKAQRRPACHHQSRADRLRRHRRSRGARGHRHGARAVRRRRVIHRCSQAVTAFGHVLHFCAFPFDGECYLRFKKFVRFVKRPRGRRHRKSGGLGVMASDGIETKSIGVGLGPDVDLTDEAAARGHRNLRRHQMVRCRQGLRLHRSRQRHGRRAAARDLPAPRRLSDRL